MKRSKKAIRHLVFVALLVCAVTAALPTTAAAQCPLCRAGLEHGGDKTARTMNLAIVVLLIPPVSIFCTIFAVAYRKRRGEGFDDEEEREP